MPRSGGFSSMPEPDLFLRARNQSVDSTARFGNRVAAGFRKRWRESAVIPGNLQTGFGLYLGLPF